MSSRVVDWLADDNARGGYTFLPPGAVGARSRLAAAVLAGLASTSARKRAWPPTGSTSGSASTSTSASASAPCDDSLSLAGSATTGSDDSDDTATGSVRASVNHAQCASVPARKML